MYLYIFQIRLFSSHPVSSIRLFLQPTRLFWTQMCVLIGLTDHNFKVFCRRVCIKGVIQKVRTLRGEGGGKSKSKIVLKLIWERGGGKLET